MYDNTLTLFRCTKYKHIVVFLTYKGIKLQKLSFEIVIELHVVLTQMTQISTSQLTNNVIFIHSGYEQTKAHSRRVAAARVSIIMHAEIYLTLFAYRDGYAAHSTCLADNFV